MDVHEIISFGAECFLSNSQNRPSLDAVAQARKRYGLTILGHMVASKHFNLLVVESGLLLRRKLK
jgi:hypothetical protein